MKKEIITITSLLSVIAVAEVAQVAMRIADKVEYRRQMRRNKEYINSLSNDSNDETTEEE